jgi:hypothetical protein
LLDGGDQRSRSCWPSSWSAWPSLDWWCWLCSRLSLDTGGAREWLPTYLRLDRKSVLLGLLSSVGFCIVATVISLGVAIFRGDRSAELARPDLRPDPDVIGWGVLRSGTGSRDMGGAVLPRPHPVSTPKGILHHCVYPAQCCSVQPVSFLQSAEPSPCTDRTSADVGSVRAKSEEMNYDGLQRLRNASW